MKYFIMFIIIITSVIPAIAQELPPNPFLDDATYYCQGEEDPEKQSKCVEAQIEAAVLLAYTLVHDIDSMEQGKAKTLILIAMESCFEENGEGEYINFVETFRCFETRLDKINEMVKEATREVIRQSATPL